MINWIKERMSAHAIACAVTLGAVVAAYLLGVYVSPGMISHLASVIPLGILCVTAIARVNDIGKDKVEKRWHVRRAGLSIVAGASAIAMLGPLAGLTAYPAWGTVALYWGFALTWLTTPEMPPWWRWISGKDDRIIERD